MVLRSGSEQADAALYDLSVSGLLCAAPATPRLTVGSVVEVTLPLGERGVAVAARVVRNVTSDEGPRYGMEFQDITATAIRQIQEYLASLIGHDTAAAPAAAPAGSAGR